MNLLTGCVVFMGNENKIYAFLFEAFIEYKKVWIKKIMV